MLEGRSITWLIICALLLLMRLTYIYVSDPWRFPVNTVKVAASYQHIQRHQLKDVFAKYAQDGFLTLPVQSLENDLMALPWTHSVAIERVWPDVLQITLQEKQPAAEWNNTLITAAGVELQRDEKQLDSGLVRLAGSDEQKMTALAVYDHLKPVLEVCGLSVDFLQLHENQACDLLLKNGVQLHLGKRDIEQRASRFCRAYPAIFSPKIEQLASVDLRYARGMAVQWKEPIMHPDK